LRHAYRTQGWIHVHDGVTPEFLADLKRCSERHESELVLHGTGIGGAKDQHLYEPPDGVDLVGELRRVVTAMCGLNGEGFTLSERHIKLYSSDADPAPTAHKDRLASQISLGVSINVPEGSNLVFYPDVHRGVNPFLTAEFSRSLSPEESPDTVLKDAPAVEIHDRPGDVIAFPGSSIWHLRRKSANTSLLYLKCNDFGSDPLGEDPSTEARRRFTIDLLARREAGDLVDVVPSLSRRLEWTGMLSGRDGVDRPAAKMWDRPLTFVSEAQLSLLADLRKAMASRPEHGLDRVSASAVTDDLVALAGRGIVDLVVARSH
jgi:hypothetical protein